MKTKISTNHFLDNKKITKWYSANRLQLPYGKYQSSDFFATTIPDEDALVNLKKQHVSSYSAKLSDTSNSINSYTLMQTVKESIPNASKIKVEGNSTSLELPNGRRLIINLVDEILSTPEQLAKASIEHGVSVTINKQLQGIMRIVGLDGII